MVRVARPDDAKVLVSLIAQLGFETDEIGLQERIQILADNGEPVLVAEESGALIGALNWHFMHALHRTAPVGRIVMLVVDEGHRSQGVGRQLVADAERRMREAGCCLAEVTSNARLDQAHGFYERLGFERSSLRFGKALD
ncbi:MAG: GNAT family N-acetyltransferase [Sphingomicrobium sp.]